MGYGSHISAFRDHLLVDSTGDIELVSFLLLSLSLLLVLGLLF